MNKILVIGCGGREHAIVKTLKKDNVEIFCMGPYINPGIYNLTKDYCTDMLKLTDFVKTHNIGMAIIGPEAYLENGTCDTLWDMGIPCIGPKSELAKLETDKIFSRMSMKYEWNMEEYIPNFVAISFRKEILDKYENSYSPSYFLCNSSDLIPKTNYVVKANGLKSGKGVKVSEDHLKNRNEAFDYCLDLIKNKEEFLIEEKLVGQEFSLMSFSDGNTLKHMPIVKDFKRAYDNDVGPNTGGMGSISYSNHILNFLNKSDVEIARTLNELVIKSLQNKTNETYKGIIYGSFIKTDDNKIKIIEYNCRFGDPECINILSILENSFFGICKSIINGTLSLLDIKYSNKYSVCRYIVPKGYPSNPIKNHEFHISGSDYNNFIFASVKYDDNSTHSRNKILDFTKLIELGSRTLSVICLGDTLQDATSILEEELDRVSGPFFFRKDIGYVEDFSYFSCGVDIDKGNEIVSEIGKHIMSTYNENVCGEFGDFGGMFKFKDSILVSSTDGVGTKSVLAYDTLGSSSLVNLGKDLVNHCVNDILVKGARPLFFLDYFASSVINKNDVEKFVKGVSESCRSVDCVLMGGETAEMPGVYNTGKMDFVGTIVGSLEEKDVIDGKKNIKKGDRVIGLRSSGPHTNGYSLIRKLVNKGLLEDDFVRDLLEPHRCYYSDIQKLINGKIKINGLCHITGGGLIENPKRVLPEYLKLKLNEDFEIGTLFKIIQLKGNLSDHEMLKVFNCGIGMLIIIDPLYVEDVLDLFYNNFAKEIGVIE